MSSLIRFVTFAFCIGMAATPALAQDSTSENSIDSLLNSIPQIQSQEPEEETEKPPEPESFDYFPDYLKNVKEALIEAWNPPGSIKKHQGLWNQVLIKVDENGQITKMTLLEPSGDTKFDKSVSKALNTATLPAPPASIQEQAMQGLPIKFRAVDKL